MNISGNDSEFIARRRQMVRVWPYFGTLLLCLLLILAVWLFAAQPLLVNPYAVLARLKSDSLPQPMLSLMAGMLPLAMLAALTLAAALVLLCFASFANEKRYLSIIDRSHRE